MLRDIEIYLPKYLSGDEQSRLFEELKQFPENIHARLYSSLHDGDGVIFQGDGLAQLPVVSLPDTSVMMAPIMVVSNTCDISELHERLYPSNIVYCPLIRFDAWREELHRAFPESGDRVEALLDSVRRQECSSMFYLPKGARLTEDRIALMDRLVHHSVAALDIERLVANRLFTLSDYGFYLFLFKLSIHLTRLREGIARGYSD